MPDSCQLVDLWEHCGQLRACHRKDRKDPAEKTAQEVSRKKYASLPNVAHQKSFQKLRSRDRYWMASEICSEEMFSSPARSARVRDILRVRS